MYTAFEAKNKHFVLSFKCSHFKCPLVRVLCFIVISACKTHYVCMYDSLPEDEPYGLKQSRRQHKLKYKGAFFWFILYNYMTDLPHSVHLASFCVDLKKLNKGAAPHHAIFCPILLLLLHFPSAAVFIHLLVDKHKVF
jgi:hypothetical protein